MNPYWTTIKALGRTYEPMRGCTPATKVVIQLRITMWFLIGTIFSRRRVIEIEVTTGFDEPATPAPPSSMEVRNA